MGKLVRFDPSRPKRLGETVFTDRGSRLASPVAKSPSRWFVLAMVLLPVSAFLLVLFY